MCTSFTFCGLRLGCNVSLVEFNGLAIIFPGIKVHLWLDQKYKVAIVSAENLSTIAVLLNVDVCIRETNQI